MNKRNEIPAERAPQRNEVWPARRTRKRKRMQIRACLLLAAVIAMGGLLLGAGRSTLKIMAGVPAASKTPVQQADNGTAITSGANGTSSVNGTNDAKAKPVPSTDDWNLILVNPWNSIPDGYEVKLTQLKNGHSVDERCYPALQRMMDDCRAAGLNPLICSSYRTQEKQERLFSNQVTKLISRGYSAEAAKKEAGTAVAVPGTSEHQLGLAVDIVDVANQNLDESQEKTAVQKWLMENSWRYGFILRYPNDKSQTTGIIYEPWHYRYVGETAAKEIYDQGVCLEEYLDQLKADL